MGGGISWFWFACLWWSVMLSIFSCVFWPSVYLLWKMFIQICCPFFNQVFFFLNLELYEFFILDSNPLLDILFGNILFSRWPFCVFNRFFCCENILVWCSSICLFLLLFLCLRRHPKGYYKDWCQRAYSLCFLLDIFVVSGHI